MQSGISVSKELHTAFNTLLSTSTQRGLLATISDESLTPTSTIPSTSPDFLKDLSSLEPLLRTDQAVYIFLRRDPDAIDGYVAITYVPDAAPVRSKMLFASSRLSLVRELGKEHFRETLIVTMKEELTAEGWRKHEEHIALKAPLTEEEESLKTVKDAEAEASRGTTARSSHVSSGINFPIADDAKEELRRFSSASHSLLQLGINVASETVHVASVDNDVTAENLATAISDSEPRYSFFRYKHEFEGKQEAPIIFIYTCPSTSKVKERMVYASNMRPFVTLAEKDYGLTIAKRLEASSPSELNAASIFEDLHPKTEEISTFSRPKRPGRR